MTNDQFEMTKLALQAIVAVGAVGAALFGWMAKKAIQDVHVSLNSRLTQLLEMTAAASRAEGRDSVRAEGGGGESGPTGPAGIQGPVGPQGQVGPQGARGAG